MIKIMKKIVLVLFLSLLFFSLTANLAQGDVGEDDKDWCEDIPIERRVGGLVPCGRSCDDPSTKNIDESKPCRLCDFFVMIDGWIDGLLLVFVPAVAALMIAIGGGMYMISQGNPEMLMRAKKLFIAVAFGLLIVYGAFLFVGTFLWAIGLADWTTDIYQNWWNQGLFVIPCSARTTSSIVTPSPSASPPSSPSPSSPSPPPPLQLSNCTLCPGNSLGQCDESICDGMTVDCNFISVTIVGGQQGGICVAPNECGACGTVSVECSAGECNSIGNQCRFIADQLGTGICVLPNECGKCASLIGGCTKQSCESIGNKCQFVQGGLGFVSSCIAQ